MFGQRCNVAGITHCDENARYEIVRDGQVLSHFLDTIPGHLSYLQSQLNGLYREERIRTTEIIQCMGILEVVACKLFSGHAEDKDGSAFCPYLVIVGKTLYVFIPKLCLVAGN